MSRLYLLLADLILVDHLLFIEFVVLGQVCIVIGYFRSWGWVRHPVFRICHLLAILFVAVQAWAGKMCPLTAWEASLREAAGVEPHRGTFVHYWVGRLVYYDVPQWWLTVAYTIFGAVVLLSWLWIRPRRRATEVCPREGRTTARQLELNGSLR